MFKGTNVDKINLTLTSFVSFFGLMQKRTAEHELSARLAGSGRGIFDATSAHQQPNFDLRPTVTTVVSAFCECERWDYRWVKWFPLELAISF